MRLPALPLPRLRLRAPVRAPRLALPRGPHARRRLVALALALSALSAAYLLWFRDSSLVRVQRVQVVGLSTAPDAARLRAQLTAAARGMTTLHLDGDALRRVVADDPVVRGIELRASFPHGLTIDVTENRPVALVAVGARTVPVAADGTVLQGVDRSGTLPLIRTVALPAGRRVDRGPALDRVSVAAAAPRALLAKLSSISIQPGRGYVAQLHDGPAIWLGSLVDLDVKWAAAAAVLAQRSSEGATYVDVRLPERAVAGGLQIQDAPQPDAVPPPPGADPNAPAPVPADPGAAPAAPQAGGAAGTGAQPAQPTPATPTQPQTGAAAPQSAPQTVQPGASATSTNTRP